MVLFHASEEAGIRMFEPRSIDGSAEPCVWAIDDDRLRNDPCEMPRRGPRDARKVRAP